MNSASFYIIYSATLALLVTFAAAKSVHVVGDSLGWTIPPNTSLSYSSWASGKTFMLGDILEFNFATNVHDVVQVPKASYDDCSDDDAIGTIITTGPVNITLDSAGDHYYICTFGSHCEAGQKLSITVVSSSTPGGAAPPPPTTTPSPVTPQPNACAPTPNADAPTARAPPPAGPTPSPRFNSASVSHASSFMLVIMSAALALIF